MENQVKETGMERLNRLRKEAKGYGITGNMKADEFQAKIDEAKANGVSPVEKTEEMLGNTGLTIEEAKKIDARLKYEFEAQEKFKIDRQRQLDRASIIAESESLTIPIDLPEKPTELELAKARQALGMKKKEVRPSPETLGIEASKRGYYVFTNREQEDAAHTVNLGGKYVIHLIPDQIHVLSEYHVKRWNRIAVTPVYDRVSTGINAGPNSVGQLGEECKRTGGRRRFMFEYLGEAPQEAQFGLVLDPKVLEEFKQEQLS